MTSAFFDWPGTGVAGIDAGAVAVDRTLGAVARSFVFCRMDDLRADLGCIPRPALLAATVLADDFMIRTSFGVPGAGWRRHRHKPRRHYRLRLWDPCSDLLRATDSMHAPSAAEVQSLWRVEEMNLSVELGARRCRGTPHGAIPSHATGQPDPYHGGSIELSRSRDIDAVEAFQAARSRVGARFIAGSLRIAICPATYTDATCKSCRACAAPREAVIGFPAHGRWRLVETAIAARDVPVGESWAFREHRTMAEVIAQKSR